MNEDDRQFSRTLPPLQSAILRFSSPILFIDERADNTLSAIGGTALFWQSIEGKFVITAWHVWSELVRQSHLPGGRMSVGIPIGAKVISLLDAKIVDHDEDLDIAVLFCPGFQKIDMSNKAFHQTTSWPPTPPHDEETVGFIGFPGELRKVRGMTLTCPSIYWEGPCQIGKSGSYLMLGAPFLPRRRVDHVPNAPEVSDIGGVSGAPVFALRNGSPQLIGLVKRGTEKAGLESSIQVTPIYRIRSDGKILRGEAQ